MSKPKELCIPETYQQDSLETIVEMQTNGLTYVWYTEKAALEKEKQKSAKLIEALEAISMELHAEYDAQIEYNRNIYLAKKAIKEYEDAE